MKQMVGKAGLELRAHVEKIGLSAKPDAKWKHLEFPFSSGRREVVTSGWQVLKISHMTEQLNYNKSL